MGCICDGEVTVDLENQLDESPSKVRQGSFARPQSNKQGSSQWGVANSSTHIAPDDTEKQLHASSEDTTSNSEGPAQFIVGKRYYVHQLIGQGSFGAVYHGRDSKTSSIVAIKILKTRGHASYYREISVLQHLQGLSGVPYLFWNGRYKHKDVLVVNRLGVDLSLLFDYCNRRFTLQTVLSIGVRILDIIKNIHNNYVIHRDVKPHNILLGYGSKKHTMNFIDFGLSKLYISLIDTKHIPFQTGLLPVGTARYASIYTHQGIAQSRRDDLESIGFILVYFLKGSLPWQGLKITSRRDKWKQIGDVKLNTKLSNLCSKLPKQFINYFQIVRQLKFDQTPDYNKLKKCFLDAAKENSIDVNNCKWDWE